MITMLLFNQVAFAVPLQIEPYRIKVSPNTRSSSLPFSHWPYWKRTLFNPSLEQMGGMLADKYREALPAPLMMSVENRPIDIYRLGDSQQAYLFFLGVFHGDEPQGKYMLEKLMEELVANPSLYRHQTIYCIPVVNPDGYKRGTRVNARHVDLNRNFPTRNFKPHGGKGTRYHAGPHPLSEPESRLLFELLAPFAATPQKVRIVSIHAPLAMNNFDGPAQALAEIMSRHNHLPVDGSIGYPTPGSFGTYYGKELGIPVITLETPKVSPEIAWQQNRDALLAVIKENSQ